MTACKFVATDQPRILTGRHVTDCAGETCAGCLPCTEPHCVVCRRAHADVTCAECLATVRDDLHTIAALCDALPAETEHRGVNGEAMMLLGPSADPEAWRNRAMGVQWGRFCRHPQGVTCPDKTPKPHGPACRNCKHRTCLVIRDDVYRCDQRQGFVDDCRDEQHPTWVLGTWEQAWRDHLDQPTDLRATLPRLVAYLDGQLHVMAETEEVPFEDFARDLRGCRGHLEDVLHDGEQRETGAPCPKCGRGALLKVYGDDEAGDRWVCQRHDCREWWTEKDYREKVGATFERHAGALTASAMRRVYRVSEGSVRGWASKGYVRKRGKDANGLQLYDVGDVVAMRDGVSA